MDIRIFKNSYITAIVIFFTLCIICYLTGIGNKNIILPDGKIVKKFNWKYPFAISLIVWVIWYFWIFPPQDSNNLKQNINPNKTITNLIGGNNIDVQRIDMTNWN
uniref:Uncharacterized protein n=1 Tax=viral metagenome TaxID=1070528 RepID=A0A6C0LV90_9ZZZZ